MVCMCWLMDGGYGDGVHVLAHGWMEGMVMVCM